MTCRAAARKTKPSFRWGLCTIGGTFVATMIGPPLGAYAIYRTHHRLAQRARSRAALPQRLLYAEACAHPAGDASLLVKRRKKPTRSIHMANTNQQAPLQLPTIHTLAVPSGAKPAAKLRLLRHPEQRPRPGVLRSPGRVAGGHTSSRPGQHPPTHAPVGGGGGGASLRSHTRDSLRARPWHAHCHRPNTPTPTSVPRQAPAAPPACSYTAYPAAALLLPRSSLLDLRPLHLLLLLRNRPPPQTRWLHTAASAVNSSRPRAGPVPIITQSSTPLQGWHGTARPLFPSYQNTYRHARARVRAQRRTPWT